MCCHTNAQTDADETLLLQHHTQHPVSKEEIVVAGYETKLASPELVRGGQAMVFFLATDPTFEFGEENVLDTTGNRMFLQNMVDTLGLHRQLAKSSRLSQAARVGSSDAPKTAVFDKGIFTIAAGRDVDDILLAFQDGRVAPEKAPHNPLLFSQMKQRRPGWSCVAFCYDASKITSIATPIILYWYKQHPRYKGKVIYPTMEGHGVMPARNELIPRNTVLLFGALPSSRGAQQVRYDPFPKGIAPFLPVYANGHRFDTAEIGQEWLNGDWAFEKEALRAGNWRVTPDTTIF